MARWVLALLVVVGGSAAVAAAEESVPELARVLLDPRASSNVKVRAALLLRRMERRAVAAVPALVRQSRYDMPAVREACAGALIGIVGVVEKRRLLAGEPLVDAHPTLDAYAQSWLDGVRGFETLYVARDLLKNPDPRYQKMAFEGLLRMRATAGEGAFDALAIQPAEVKSEVIDLLGETADRFRLGEALDLATALGPEDPGAARLVLRVLTFEGADDRARAGAYADRIFVPSRATPQLVEAVVDAMLDSNPYKRLAAKGAVDRLGPAARPRIVGELTYRVARGQPMGRETLALWADMAAPVAKLASAIAGLPSPAQGHLAEFLREPRPDGERLGLLAGYIASPDPRTADVAVHLCVVLYADRIPDVLARAIERGHLLDGRVIEALAPRRGSITGIVSPYLREGGGADGSPGATPGQHAAALAVVRFVGFGALEPEALAVLVGDSDQSARAGAIQALTVTGFEKLGAPTLKGMLGDRDEGVRVSAAEALGDLASMARARMPGWLADLRGGDLAARHRAARQIEASGAYDRAFCAALLRAVERRDMVLREALALALERAARDGAAPLAALRALAADEADPAGRAYARVALREFR